MREREVRYITNEAQTEYFVVRPEWRGLRVRRAGGADRGRDRVHGARERHAADRRSVGAATAARSRAGRGAGCTTRPDPRPTPRARGTPTRRSSRACTRSSPGSSRRPTTCIRSASPSRTSAAPNMLGAALHVGYLLPLVEAFDAERSPHFMAEQGATLLGTALPMFQAYLAAQRTHGDEPLFPRLRTCVGGGAPKTAGIDDVIRRELGGLGVVSSWGLTEFPTATSASVDDTPAADRDHRGSPVARRRAPRRRPRRERVRPGRGGRAPAPGPAPVPRLRQPRARRRRARRAGLLPHRRPRHRRRHRPRDHHRSVEGHHHPQRGEHLGQRGRGGPAPAPGRSPTSR